MLDSIRILKNVVDQNNYETTDVAYLRADTHPVDFYVQLWQSDLELPYVPDLTATVTIEFLRSDTVGETPTSQTQSLSASASFADRSIWKVTLVEENVQKIVSGGFRVVIEDSVDPDKKETIWSSMSIRKLPSDQNPLLDEV